jgi:hypothetical protein
MSSDVLIPSHSAVFAQVNDVYAIKRFKKRFGKCVARTKVLRNVTATSKMTRDNINEIIIPALTMFWMENDDSLERRGINQIKSHGNVEYKLERRYSYHQLIACFDWG